MKRSLILGGARSGKSAYAEQLALASGLEVVYLATASAGDAEMAARIAHHQARRPATWRTVETPLALAEALAHWRSPRRLVLVDCLTLWLSNQLFADGTDYPDVGTISLPARWLRERAALLQEIGHDCGAVIFVSNEVGMGIVPYGAISRAFADEAGRLNQAVAAACDTVTLVAAGLPLRLKGD
jgi:adenosylcobinamide kinase/adenosylcobinamide-phosphate guanylyltransferase